MKEFMFVCLFQMLLGSLKPFGWGTGENELYDDC
jgi:hypothetical protein